SPTEAISLLVALEVLARQSAAPPARREPKRESTGSGFAVSGQGHLLTNNHVVAGCRVASQCVPSSQQPARHMPSPMAPLSSRWCNGPMRSL
ncbi:MAG: hypothetical protein FJX68_19115, partial [Alphaproteobacteria bacterium]|nr:hypothetical protein [Alphaproteobacteria bacterium]